MTNDPSQPLQAVRSLEGVDMEVLKTAVLLACRAPSVHNSQPWRWVADRDRDSGSEVVAVHLFADRGRTVPATDHSGRETLISCGAVLDHLGVAMTAAGWQPSITRFPTPDDPNHLATVDFSPIEEVTETELKRAESILQRRTDRLAFDRPRYWDLFEGVLRNTIDNDIAMLDVLTDEQRPQLVQASHLSAALRRDDLSYYAELDWWTSPFVLTDGVPPLALASDTERQRVDLSRDFPVRSHQDRRPEITSDWSKILVLSTPGDTRADVLRCGEVLSSVLLECTMAGMATCTLTHLIESNESRDIVADLIGRRRQPQVLIRAGITPLIEEIPAPTPRRGLDSIFEVRQKPEKG